MQRSDVLRELAAIVRRDHHSAAFAVGWLAKDCSTEALEDLLTAIREEWPPTTRPGHLAVYEERWGVVPRTT